MNYKPLSKHYDRKSTNLEEQICILKKRGLIIDNNADTLNKLENIGYFKFKGYCYPFYSDKDKFGLNNNGEPYTFEHVYQSYIFDQKIHSLLFSLCNRIETQFKSRLGMYLSQKYGPLGYMDSKMFNDIKNYQSWIAELNKNKDRAKQRKEAYIGHYEKDYSDEFPIWIALEISSFGDISKLYSDLANEDKKEFAEIYGFNYTYIESWIHFIAVVRNYSAHNSRTFSKKFHVNPKISKREKNIYNITNKGTAFSALFIAKKICKSQNFYLSIVNDIANYIKIYNKINISKWGFPNDWHKILQIE